MELKINNDKNFEEEIGKQLHQFNKKNCEYIQKNSTERHTNTKKYNIAIYDKERLIGGAIGFIRYEWYFLEEFPRNLGGKVAEQKLIKKFNINYNPKEKVKVKKVIKVTG